MPTVWLDTLFNNDIASGGQFVLSLMTGVSATQTRFDRMTLTRTIIGLDLAYTVHDSGEGSQRVTAGIAITSQEAFAASAVPDPEVASDHPVRGWVWRASYRIFGFAADQAAVYDARIDEDIHAQRKLDNGESYVIFVNEPVEGVASVARVTGIIRQLWLVG